MKLLMRRNPDPIGSTGRRPRPRPRRLLAGVVAVLLGMPGAAYPISLSHLLRLPLEELLRLEISKPAPAPRLRSSVSAPLPMNAERRNP